MHQHCQFTGVILSLLLAIVSCTTLTPTPEYYAPPPPPPPVLAPASRTSYQIVAQPVAGFQFTLLLINPGAPPAYFAMGPMTPGYTDAAGCADLCGTATISACNTNGGIAGAIATARPWSGASNSIIFMATKATAAGVMCRNNDRIPRAWFPLADPVLRRGDTSFGGGFAFRVDPTPKALLAPSNGAVTPIGTLRASADVSVVLDPLRVGLVGRWSLRLMRQAPQYSRFQACQSVTTSDVLFATGWKGTPPPLGGVQGNVSGYQPTSNVAVTVHVDWRNWLAIGDPWNTTAVFCLALESSGENTWVPITSHYAIASSPAVNLIVLKPCALGYRGDGCSQCAIDYFNVTTAGSARGCVHCSRESSRAINGLYGCSGHGACFASAGTVRCDCEPAWSGAECELCAPNLFGPFCNITCSRAICSYRGSCNAFGTCACDPGYAPLSPDDRFCQGCEAKHYGPNCVYCDDVTTCGGGKFGCDYKTGLCIISSSPNAAPYPEVFPQPMLPPSGPAPLDPLGNGVIVPFYDSLPMRNPPVAPQPIVINAPEQTWYQRWGTNNILSLAFGAAAAAGIFIICVVVGVICFRTDCCGRRSRSSGSDNNQKYHQVKYGGSGRALRDIIGDPDRRLHVMEMARMRPGGSMYAGGGGGGSTVGGSQFGASMGRLPEASPPPAAHEDSSPAAVEDKVLRWDMTGSMSYLSPPSIVNN